MSFKLTFDTFFKESIKSFFAKFKFKVETEVEIFNQPQKLDVLLIKQKELTENIKDFEYFNYFKKYNLISFKSPNDPVRKSDFYDSSSYINGFLKNNKNLDENNITFTLIVNNHPRNYLAKHKEYIKEIEKGHYIVNFNLYQIHILDLTRLEFNGYDGKFLLNFAPSKKLELLIDFFEEKISQKDKKIVAKLKSYVYTRIKAFEKNSILEKYMPPTLAEADVTEWVMPFYNKGIENEKIENTKKMLIKNYNIHDISDITGLTISKINKIKKEMTN